MSNYAAARHHTMQLISDALSGLVDDAYIYWQGVVPQEGKGTPPAGEAFAVVHFRHHDNGTRQASLAGATGRKRWRNTGTVMVQCFSPLGAQGGDATAMALAKAIQSKFQTADTRRPVVYLNPTAREVGADRSWFQCNASATFQYDEVI